MEGRTGPNSSSSGKGGGNDNRRRQYAKGEGGWYYEGLGGGENSVPGVGDNIGFSGGGEVQGESLMMGVGGGGVGVGEVSSGGSEWVSLIDTNITGADLDLTEMDSSDHPTATTSIKEEEVLTEGLASLNLEPQSGKESGSSIEFRNLGSLSLKPVRPTFGLVPVEQSLLSKTGVRLGKFFTPFSEKDNSFPTVTLPTQCQYCSAYLQPNSVRSTDLELWQCGLCGYTSQVPDLNRDLFERSWSIIRSHSNYDILLEPRFIEPPFFYFVIDTSYSALKNGMFTSIIFSLREILPNLVSSLRVGFLTVNSSLQFYSFESSTECPTMVEMTDMDDPYVPLPSSRLLVPIGQYWQAISLLLDTIESIHESTFRHNNGLGAALSALSLTNDFLVGSIIVFQTTLPNIGPGGIVKTGGTSIMGTDKEYTLLNAKDDFYRGLSLRFSSKFINLDFFSFGSSDFDLPTIAPLIKYTGGSLYYYPDFKHDPHETSHDRPLPPSTQSHPSSGGFDTLFTDLHNLLYHRKAYAVTFCALVPYGMAITNINGNLVRNSSATGFVGMMGYGDSVSVDYTFEDRPYFVKSEQGTFANFQGTFSYINLQGDQMLRVLNSSLPCTASLPDFLSSIDAVAYASYLIREGLALVTRNTLAVTRNQLRDTVLSYFKCHYQTLPHPRSTVERFLVPYRARLLPYLIHAAHKHPILQSGAVTPVNDRIYWHAIVTRCAPELLLNLLCPPILALALSDSGTPILTRLNPSSERFASATLFILDFGRDLHCWARNHVTPPLLARFFQVDHYGALPSSQYPLDPPAPALSHLLRTYLLRHPRLHTGHSPPPPGYLPTLHLLHEGDPLPLLPEDHHPSHPSYQQFLLELRKSLLTALPS